MSSYKRLRGKTSKSPQNFSNSKQITLSDWLKHCPYPNVINNYDTQFVPICNQVLTIFNKHKDYFDHFEIEPEYKKSLSIAIVAYFEDYISEIGIWKSFVNYNQSIYGYYLPFYDLTEYDTEYLNIEDIAYIIYHFFSLDNLDEVINPILKIWDLAEEIYNYLEPLIDSVNPTSFYEKYLKISATDDYFLVKEKMVWFTTKSYLLGFSFAPIIQDASDKIINFVKKNMDYAPHIEMLLYQSLDDLVLMQRSSFSALNTAEWFALLANADDATKECIRNLQFRHSGAYLYTEKTGNQYFKYINMESQREYLVHQESVKVKKEPASPNSTVFNLHFIFWDGKWWQSGSAIGASKESYSGPMIKPHLVPWTYNDTQKESAKISITNMYKSHVDFFGSPLYIANDIDDLVEKMMGVTKSMGSLKKDEKEEAERLDAMKKRLKKQYQKAIGNAKNIAFFFIEGKGQYIMPDINQLLDVLQKENATKEEKNQSFFTLIDYNPYFAQYILEHFPVDNLNYMHKVPNSNPYKLLPYFWRFYHPSEFGIKVPDVSLVDSSKIKFND